MKVNNYDIVGVDAVEAVETRSADILENRNTLICCFGEFELGEICSDIVETLNNPLHPEISVSLKSNLNFLDVEFLFFSEFVLGKERDYYK